MDELSAPRYIMPMIVSSCQHCDKQQFQTLLCVHYTFIHESKVRFINTSTATKSQSCSEKTTRTPGVYLVYNNTNNIFRVQYPNNFNNFNNINLNAQGYA